MKICRRRPLIGVIGDASVKTDDRRYEIALQLGQLLIDHGFRVMTGGLGGIMEAACKGARRSTSYAPGDTIGVLPGHDTREACNAIDIVIPTGLDIARSSIVAHADAIVAIGGGAGTLSEMAVAWMLKRLILSFRVEGWSGRLADSRIDNRVRYKQLLDDKVFGVDTPKEATIILEQRLSQYNSSHHGIHQRIVPKGYE